MKMILTGDVNLMNVTDPAVPFALVAEEFRAADVVFCNLECCLYRPADCNASPVTTGLAKKPSCSRGRAPAGR